MEHFLAVLHKYGPWGIVAVLMTKTLDVIQANTAALYDLKGAMTTLIQLLQHGG